MSAREIDRVYGKAWFELMRSSRCTLGTSSGASVIDFTGEIKKKCDQFLSEHPQATYEQVRERFFADVDGKVVIDTISPRIFEASALGTVLVLQEGDYSGILEPDHHYIRIRRDYSNIEEVVNKMRDPDYCRTLRTNAHRDLIASGKYSYRAFGKWFDKILREIIPASTARARVSPRRFHLHRYWNHGQTVLPYKDRYVRLAARPSRVMRKLALRALRRVNPSMTDLPENLVLKLCTGIVYGTRFGCLSVLMKRAAAGGSEPISVYCRIQDAYRLSVLRAAQQRDLRTPTPFNLRFAYEQGSARLNLISVRPEAPLNGHGEEAVAIADVGMLRQIAKEREIRSIIWDHSRIDRTLHFQFTRFRRATIDLGSAGQIELAGLTSVLSGNLEAGLRLLRPVLESGKRDAD